MINVLKNDMGKITVVMNSEQRQGYLKHLLQLDGLSHIEEDPRAAYCPISLTATPVELKCIVKSRKKILRLN
mgnify:CR=1 FL=1